MPTMTLTGTFTIDDLMQLSNETALQKLIEIRERGLGNEFTEWADTVTDWDEIHSILNGYTVDEILEIEEEDESEDEQWNY